MLTVIRLFARSRAWPYAAAITNDRFACHLYALVPSGRGVRVSTAQ